MQRSVEWTTCGSGFRISFFAVRFSLNAARSAYLAAAGSRGARSRAASLLTLPLLITSLAGCGGESGQPGEQAAPAKAPQSSAPSATSAVKAPARGAARVECKDVASRILRRSVRYCAILPPSYDAAESAARRYPVLYFLHGLGDNEQSLVNFGGWNLLENLQDARRIGEYIVVTPAGGTGFYINARSGTNRYEDFFIREFVPAIERAYRIDPRRERRGLAGVSMGGYGALRFAFAYPELFASVSAHSAALMESVPRVAPNSPRVQSRIQILGGVFGMPLDEKFLEQQSPFTIAKQRPTAQLKRVAIYFDCGSEDDYGFDAGAQAMHELLERRGVAHEFHLYPGGHNPLYVAEHLPATFEFHSKAFGMTEKAK